MDPEAARDEYGHISIWNTSEVTDMGALFSTQDDECSKAAKGFDDDILRWDVGKVNFLDVVFYGASSFYRDLSGWDMSNVTTTKGMFYDASLFNGDIYDRNVL